MLNIYSLDFYRTLGQAFSLNRFMKELQLAAVNGLIRMMLQLSLSISVIKNSLQLV